MIFLFEQSEQPHAMMVGASLGYGRTYQIPSKRLYPDVEWDDFLAHIPNQESSHSGIWVGYIPASGEYECLYNALLDRNIVLVNTPEQHKRAMEFDAFYPIIQKHTPQSIVISAIDECADAASKLGFPIFVKGSIKSDKEGGLKACVASNLTDLEALVSKTLKSEYKARNKAILRQFVDLEYSKEPQQSKFPIGREFRYIVYRNRIITSGYYWGVQNELSLLSDKEKKHLDEFVTSISQLLDIPLVAIDVARLVDGRWIVIEIGDPQCCGVDRTMTLKFMGYFADIKE